MSIQGCFSFCFCSRLHAYLTLAQLAFAGFEILSRIALTNGTHPLAFTFYRNCIAAILLGAVAYFRESGKHGIPSFRTLVYFFGLGFLGVTVNQVCYLAGLKYTSAIFASAMRNSTPVFTFLIAALRIEKVHLRRRDGQLKVLGTVLGLCGSLILSVYRGPVVIKSDISISQSGSAGHKVDVDAKKTLDLFGLIHISLASWQIGAIFLTISCVAFGSFLILQTPVLEKYSAPISFAAITCFSSVIQMPLLGVIYERKWNTWKLSWPSEALAIFYAGVIGSGLVSSIQSWGVLTQGPVIVAAYQPLETLFTALFSMVFLKEDLHLGSIIGGVIVIAGLYSLIWGQHKERGRTEEPSLVQLPQTSTWMELHPTLSLNNAFRRYSCDLETRRRENHEEVKFKRRHSLTCCNEFQETQGPFRRMSSTFRSLLRDFDKGGGSVATDSQQLLPSYYIRNLIEASVRQAARHTYSFE